MLKRLAAKAGVVAASAALLAGANLGTAQASTTAGYIGDGYANNANAVWCVQHLYNAWAKVQRDVYGYVTRDIGENGVWNAETENAVTLFPYGYSYLTPDGIVGPSTGTLLLKQDTYYGGHNYCFPYIPSSQYY
ncbi:hypothetical protein [Streptomyces sp. NPDC020983]|uniref:hypothetical protein n=1 Tax=Streptomyces sp. NPDC020983 TaxID=3365106 RepID=UPI0037AA4ED0